MAPVFTGRFVSNSEGKVQFGFEIENPGEQVKFSGITVRKCEGTVAETVVCSNFGTCSVTCGGGMQTCQNTCQNGDLDDGACWQSCNAQACPGLWNSLKFITVPRFYSKNIFILKILQFSS